MSDFQLEKRLDNLMSNFNIFLGHLIFKSQCSDESSYMGGLFQLKTSKIIEVVFYLLKHHRILEKIEFSQEELLKQQIIYGDDKIDYNELAQLLRSELMLKLIKSIYPALSEEKRSEVSFWLESTDFVTARSHVQLLRAQYQVAVECYIKQPNKLISQLIFPWMELNLTQSKAEDENKFLILKDIMRKKLPDFIRINSEKTHLLFQKYLNDAEHDILSKLSDNPTLELLYISNVIKQYKIQIKEDPEKLKIDKSILILNIQLMCQLAKSEEEILAEITSLDLYPLKVISHQPYIVNILNTQYYEIIIDILVICQTEKYLEVCSHIYLRMGCVDMALQMQINILENLLTEYRKYLDDIYEKIDGLKWPGRKKQPTVVVGDDDNQKKSVELDKQTQLSKREEICLSIFGSNNKSQTLNVDNQNKNVNENIIFFNTSMDNIIQKMLSICQTNDKPSENWFLLLDLLIKVEKKQSNIGWTDHLSQIHKRLGEKIGITVIEMAKYINMDDLILKLRDKNCNLEFAELRETFRNLLEKNIDDSALLFSSLKFIQSQLLDISIDASQQFLAGVFSQTQCAACLLPLYSIFDIRTKIRKQLVHKNEDNSIISESNSNNIIVFFCGHAYHTDCCYQQKNIRICTECIQTHTHLYLLMTIRKDVDILLLSNRLSSTAQIKANSDLIRSNSSADSAKKYTQIDQSEKNEITKFKQIKGLQKLKNFDKEIKSKYSHVLSLHLERPPKKYR